MLATMNLLDIEEVVERKREDQQQQQNCIMHALLPIKALKEFWIEES